METLDHLSQIEKEQLESILNKYTKVFDGKLGRHPTAKISIELKPGSRPIWQKPYPVPFQKKATFEKELYSLVGDGVLSPVGMSRWGFPSFIIPKKDGRVRWLSDF